MPRPPNTFGHGCWAGNLHYFLNLLNHEVVEVFFLLQTEDMYVYTYNHTDSGWFCPGWGGDGSTIDTVSA